MQYSRMTEEQDRARNAWPKGDYPFIVKAIEDKPTRSGENMMLVVDMEVHNNEGKTKKMKDWVVYDMESMAWKFRHLSATTGLLAKYEDGSITPGDFLEKHGVVRLTTSEYTDNDGETSVQNTVKDYVKPGEAKGTPAAIVSGLPADEPFNDDLPL